MTRRLLLDKSADDQHFALVAGRNGWFPYGPPHESELSYERRWEAEGGAIVTWVHDHLLDVRYVHVRGGDREAVERKVRATLPVLGRDDIHRRFAQASDQHSWIRAIYYAAAFADDSFDPDLFALFEKAMAHADPEVRRAAVFATTYPAWTEFRPVLERLRAEDASEEVRHDADVTLDALHRHMWGKE
jgi:hypothetical protein